MDDHDRAAQAALFDHVRDRPVWPSGIVERRLELLRPRQIVALREQSPLIYIPVGTIEWHERHMPVGTDGFTAHGISLRAAAITGGVVYPTLYWGLDEYGTTRSGASRSGMDIAADMPLPGNIYRVGHETYGRLLSDAVAECRRTGYRAVALVTGHGSRGQIHAIHRVANATNEAVGHRCVIAVESFMPAMNLLPDGGGHAGRSETALILGLHPELVDFAEAPPQGSPVIGADDARPHAIHGAITEADGARLVQACVDALVARAQAMIDSLP
jgi:creatinine amidohydrolase